MPTPVPTNSESDSRVAELEARIRQLEAENQRLLTENRRLEAENQRVMSEYQQLSSDLAKVTAAFQNVQSLVTSQSYTTALGGLNDVQNETSRLTAWIKSLPHLPPIPIGLDASRIDEAIINARNLWLILKNLPDLPPPGWPPFIPFPEELRQLDEGRRTFITMTEWMENLQPLPEFLRTAGGLEDLRSRIEGYMRDVENTASDARGMLEQVRDVASP